MRKDIVITLIHEDIIELLSLDRIDIDHERDERTPTGIRAIFKCAIKNGETIKLAALKEMILAQLESKGHIEGKGWNVFAEATHSWGPFDDDGYGYSIYRLTMQVKKEVEL